MKNFIKINKYFFELVFIAFILCTIATIVVWTYSVTDNLNPKILYFAIWGVFIVVSIKAYCFNPIKFK